MYHTIDKMEIINTTSVGSPGHTLPTSFRVEQNYPNPFNSSMTIRYALNREVHVTMRIYDMLGSVVRTLVDETQPGGYREIRWEGSNDRREMMSSGIYICRVTAGDMSSTKKLILLR
jgi:hypothetical protein